MQNRVKADYAAGLWSNNLVEGIFFWTQGTDDWADEQQSYIAPSWSWALYDGRIAFNSRGREIASVVDYGTTLKGPNPFGEVTDGWIKLKAPLLRMTVSNEPKREQPENPDIRLRTATGDSYGTDAHFDRINQINERSMQYVRDLTLYALVLNEGRRDFFGALVVTPENSDSTRMKRVGRISLEKSLSPEDVDILREQDKFTLVTLT